MHGPSREVVASPKLGIYLSKPVGRLCRGHVWGHTDAMSGAEAGRALSRMLADPVLGYREIWERRGAAYRGRALNQSSIAKVIAAYLVDQGLLAEFEENDWPRSRRDWIRSRLAGEMLTHLELELFMTAFQFQDEDRERLRVVLQAGRPPVIPDEIRLGGLPDREAYELLRTFDEQVFGPTGLPTRRTTRLTMRALRDGVEACLYLLDTPHATVVVTEGGTASRPQRVGELVWAVAITLDQTLSRGATHELVYETTLDYDDAPLPQLRRLAPGEGGQVEMALVFDPARPPQAVHATSWAGVMDVEPISALRAQLDGQHRASALWTVARFGLVGFTWDW